MTSLTTLVAIVPLLLVYMKPIRRGKAPEVDDEGAAAIGSEGR